MNYGEYIRSELLLLIPVLNIVGAVLKKSRLPDRWIPLLLGGLGILLLDGLEDVNMLLSGFDIMVQLRGGNAHAGAVPETGQEFVEPLVVCRCPDGGVDGKVQLFVFLR